MPTSPTRRSIQVLGPEHAAGNHHGKDRYHYHSPPETHAQPPRHGQTIREPAALRAAGRWPTRPIAGRRLVGRPGREDPGIVPADHSFRRLTPARKTSLTPARETDCRFVAAAAVRDVRSRPDRAPAADRASLTLCAALRARGSPLFASLLRTSRSRLVGSSRRLQCPADAEVRRGQNRIVVAKGDRGPCSVRRSSGERRGDMRLLSLARAPVSKHPCRPTRRRSNRQRPRRAAVAPAQTSGPRTARARLLRSRRGSDLRAGSGAARDSYRTKPAAGSSLPVLSKWAIHFRPPGCVACGCGDRASSGGR